MNGPDLYYYFYVLYSIIHHNGIPFFSTVSGKSGLPEDEMNEIVNSGVGNLGGRH